MDRGLTLIDLLLATVIIMVIAGMAVFALFGSAPTAHLQGAVRQLQSDLRLAQDMAISTGSRHRVVFSPGSGTYSIEVRDPGTGTWSPVTGPSSPVPLAGGVVVKAASDLAQDTLIFDSLGAPHEGSGAGTPLTGTGPGGKDHVLLASPKGGRTAEVIIAPGTGRVEGSW